MGQAAGPGTHEQAIGVAVVVPCKLDNLVASSEGPGQPDGAHAGLGAGVDQPQRLDAGQGPGDQPRQLHLLLHRRAEAGAASRRPLQGRHHRRVGVSKDQRPPGAEVVDVFVAVHVDDSGAAAGRDEGRRAGDGAEGPHGTVDAPGHEALGFGEKGFGLGELHGCTSCY